MKTRRKKQTQRQKNSFTLTSGGFVIVITNNSLNGSKQHQSLPRNYLKELSWVQDIVSLPLSQVSGLGYPKDYQIFSSPWLPISKPENHSLQKKESDAAKLQLMRLYPSSQQFLISDQRSLLNISIYGINVPANSTVLSHKTLTWSISYSQLTLSYSFLVVYGIFLFHE